METTWWSGLTGENLFMEITNRSDRDDFGEFLNAPLNARGGQRTPGYDMVPLVGRDSLVVHYDSGAKEITGVSRATGERFDRPIWWAAKGTYARQAGVEPSWQPGFSVALAEYEPLASPWGWRESRPAETPC